MLTNSKGIKFVIIAEPNTTAAVNLGQLLREIYVLYTDCCLKDPFYELEMPIRCDLFTQGVVNLIQQVERINYSTGSRIR